MEPEDDEHYIPTNDQYDSDEENDTLNEITLDGEVEPLTSEQVQSQIIDIFWQEYTNDGLHVCKSIFHKHFSLYLYDEGIEFSRILKFKLEQICDNSDIEELVIKWMAL